jgi:hypothetical protein
LRAAEEIARSLECGCGFQISRPVHQSQASYVRSYGTGNISAMTPPANIVTTYRPISLPASVRNDWTRRLVPRDMQRKALKRIFDFNVMEVC